MFSIIMERGCSQEGGRGLEEEVEEEEEKEEEVLEE